MKISNTEIYLKRNAYHTKSITLTMYPLFNAKLISDTINGYKTYLLPRTKCTHTHHTCDYMVTHTEPFFCLFGHDINDIFHVGIDISLNLENKGPGTQ